MYESHISFFQSIPGSNIAWHYKDTYINNGSTLINDIDMRHYYYLEYYNKFDHVTRSELFVTSVTVDDNGTFTCVAENRAGRANAKFILHVVVPMPPKPPQVI